MLLLMLYAHITLRAEQLNIILKICGKSATSDIFLGFLLLLPVGKENFCHSNIFKASTR